MRTMRQHLYSFAKPRDHAGERNGLKKGKHNAGEGEVGLRRTELTVTNLFKFNFTSRSSCYHVTLIINLIEIVCDASNHDKELNCDGLKAKTRIQGNCFERARR